jgi:hypothetical protein
MCFSAPASFAASALLAGAGALALRAVRQPGQRAFAVIPLIFAVQQFIEGWLWLGLSAPAPVPWLGPATRAYLVFSQMVWPTWVPIALLAMEQHAVRRTWLRRITGAGALVAVYYGWVIFSHGPQATIEGHHVHYTLAHPWLAGLAMSVLYFIATVLAVFVSSGPRMWVLGMALLLSWSVAAFSFPGNEISVWCYFAALISTVIIGLLRAAGRPGAAPVVLAV